MEQDTNELIFAEEEIVEGALPEKTDDTRLWKILVVDDEDEVHKVTRIALKGFSYENRKLDLISVYRGQEAMAAIKENPDTALILLDVVMEHDDSGLQVVKYIREIIKNKFVRIILRTGQPGQAPEEKVIVDYDINDYKSKQDLTTEKLFTTLTASLRSYNDLIRLAELNNALLESEERFRLISKSANDAIIMMDNNGLISFWNNAAEGIFGYKSDEVMGRDLHILLAPQKYHDAIKTGLETFNSTGTGTMIGQRIELTALTKDREEFPIELSLSGVLIKGQWNAIGIVKDIVERKLYESRLFQNKIKLEKAQAELDALINAFPDCLTMLSQAEPALNKEIKQTEPALNVIWTNIKTDQLLLDEPPACYQLLGNNLSRCEDCPVLLSFETGNTESSILTTADGIVYNISTIPIKDGDGCVTRVIERARLK